MAKQSSVYLVYSLLFLACVFALFPIAWGFVTSLKGEAEVVSYPPSWIPASPTLENYVGVLSSDLPHYLLNSILVAVLTIILSLAIAAHAGYAVARLDFRGRSTVLYLILASMMIARVSNIVPLYLLSSQLGLLDTKLALVLVYSGWQMPIAVWLLKDFFANVPQSLERAAQVDGYGALSIFYRIALPLVRPGLAAAAILIFMFVWNDFILAVTLTTSGSNRMVTVGLYNYVGQFGIQWGPLMAAVMVALLPVVILFGFVQKTLTHGLTAGAVKG
jgi:ABC-type glycerol-3-phosphate transport system permease component